MTEERGIRAACRLTQTGSVRGRDQRARRFVEADVPVEPQPENLQIDAAGFLNRSFVADAFLREIRRRAVEQMDPAGVEVDVIEQVPAHETVIAARIVAREPDELVEVERGGATEVRAACPVESNQRSIEGDGRAPGRQPQHRRWLSGQQRRHPQRERSRDTLFGLKDANTHGRRRQSARSVVL